LRGLPAIAQDEVQRSMRNLGGARTLAIGFALAMLLLRLCAEPPDHGYTRYATIAFEMVRSGDWVAPQLDGRLYVDKPPIAIWLIAVPMALASSSASLVQHMPNLVALALSVLFLRRLGARIFGRSDAGWLAAGIYVATLLPYALLRDKRIDPLFAALLLGALDFLHAALALHAPSRERLAKWLASAALLAVATITKGPLALAFFLAIALAYAAFARRLADLATREVLAAAVLYVALVAAWPLAMLGDIGFSAWSTRVGERKMVSRFAGPLHYVASLPLRLAPWSLLLPALALSWRSLLHGATGAALRLPVTWFGVVFVLLHVTSAKHARYLLPAFPALALALVALWIEPGTGGATALTPRVRRWRDGALAVALAIAALVGVAMPFAPLLEPDARVVWPALVLGGALTLWVSIAGLRLLRAGGDAIAVLARAVVAVLLVEACFDGVRGGNFLADDGFAKARAAVAEAGEATPLLTVNAGGNARNALLLATGRSVADGRDAADALRFAQQSGGGLVMTIPETLAALRAEPGLAIGEAVPLRLAGRSLVLAPLRPLAP
jgi:4-amino-4-deoxy-L-arabinose transferase-like glycosyltransferase